MAKIIYQDIPSDYYDIYRETLKIGYKHGFNFYLDNYIYTYANIVSQRIPENYPRSRAGIAPILYFDKRFRQWLFVIAGKVWQKQKAGRGVVPPQTGYRSKKWWWENNPRLDKRYYAWFVEQCMNWYGNYRVAPWAMENYVYLTNTATDKIYKVDINLKLILQQAGTTGSGNGEFNGPTGLILDDRYIYVCNTGNKRITKLEKSDLSFVTNINTYTAAGIEFLNIVDISLDDTYLYVLDKGNNRLIRINKTDNTDAQYTNLLIQNYNSIKEPEKIFVNNDAIFVTDKNNNRIAKYDRITFSREKYNAGYEFDEQDIHGPSGIDTDGWKLLVHETTTNKIVFLSAYLFYILKRQDIEEGIDDIVSSGNLLLLLNGTTGKIILIDLTNFTIFDTIIKSEFVGCRNIATERQQLFTADITE